MQYTGKNLPVLLSALFVAAAAPAILLPGLTSQAQAQTAAGRDGQGGEYATVKALSGPVEVTRPGGAPAVILERRTNLSAGDIVRTGIGGKVSLLFNDGSEIRLNSATAVQLISGPSSGAGTRVLLRLMSGQVWAQLRPGWAIETPAATARVRGTTLDLLVGEAGTVRLTTLVGTVDFFNEYGLVQVSESQQSQATAGAAPTAPVTIANSGLIVDWTLDLNRAAISRERFLPSVSTGPVATSSEALAALAATARANPGDSAARLAYGDALYNARQFGAALAEYQAAQSALPSPAGVQVRLGFALLELDRLAEAEAAFQAASVGGGADAAPARNGQGWLELRRSNAAGALQKVSGAPEADAEAGLIRGIALSRSARLDDAAQALEKVGKSGDGVFGPQALSWLALVRLAQNDTAAAEAQADLAATQAPNSAAVLGNVALVHFFSNRPKESARAARQAVRLNPDSVAAQVALGQAALAAGNADEAAVAGARAVALDPGLPEAHYLLGVADAARRDYVHARLSLRRSLELSPNFLPAASALGRVYNRTGNQEQAVTLLREVSGRQPANPEVLPALAEVYYDQGNYEESVRLYQEAVSKNPTALTYSGLTRAALDSNQLNLAINAGQKAVELAPQVGAFRANLGLAYSRSGLASFAEREFRAALAVDPQNALALVQLGFLNQEGDARTTARTNAVTYAQGFLFDPAISRDLLRGGIKTEVDVHGGPDTLGGRLDHRLEAMDGRLNVFGRLNYDKDDGDQAHSRVSAGQGRLDTTYSPDGQTNYFVHGLYSRTNRELPGYAIRPSTDDEARNRFGEGLFSFRHHLDSATTVWGSLFASDARNEIKNPNVNGLDFSPWIGGGPLAFAPISNEVTDVKALTPEIRVDKKLDQGFERAGLFSFGIARADTRVKTVQRFDAPGQPEQFSGLATTVVNNDNVIAYGQVSGQVDSRLSLSAQLRGQRLSQSGGRTGAFQDVFNGVTDLSVAESTVKRTTLYPSMVLNYQAQKKTLLRLFANRRTTDTTPSILIPNDTLLTSEGQVVPRGLPNGVSGDLKTYELDVERHLAAGTLLKLYGFRASGRNVQYTTADFATPYTLNFSEVIPNIYQLSKVERTGAGIRLEKQLNRDLFGVGNLLINRTRATSPGQAFDGQTAPYQPKVLGGLGLNYINPGGNKLGLRVNYAGSFFQDDFQTAGPRPKSPSRTTVDLLLAREPNVGQEFYLTVTNLFDKQQIFFNGIPLNGRRIQAGYTRRF